MGRRRKQGNSTPQKSNNSTENLVGNEENEYPVPYHNRMMISMYNELSDDYKDLHKKELKNELIETLMEKLQDKIKQNIQNQFKEYQDTTNRKLEK
jgi:hypothetical protein